MKRENRDVKPAAGRCWEARSADLPPQLRQAMDFLYGHLPASDLDCYPFELFLDFAGHALFLRENDPVCGALDWEIFAHYVLFPRVNDEDLSPHRTLFYRELSPRLAGIEDERARVLAVNRWCHEYASYQAQDERTASPLTVFRCGSGRCGELSAFLVSALRSMGIPARQVYVPRWSHCDDNHAWVEALCGGEWRFFGGCEPEPVADRGWFNTAASRAMLVHSRLFGPGASPLHGQPLGREGIVTWYNQTARYAPVREFLLRAVTEDGAPAVGARLELQVLNEGSFHTIAALTADAQGTARAELGLGSLHVLARWNGLTAEADCTDGAVTLALRAPDREDTGWREFDFSAPNPSEQCRAVLTPEQKRERAQTHASGDALRARRLAGYYDGKRAASLPDGQELLRGARGNFGELFRFLRGEDLPARVRLVRTLTDKDLRDVTAQILEDHLQNLPPRQEDVPEELYWQYAACPRIALEPLSPWRSEMKRALGSVGGPEKPGNWLDSISFTADADCYHSLYWTVSATLESGRCGGHGKALLAVAALRTLGIPARLRPLDGAPELWRDGAFRPLSPEETGRLHLIWNGAAPPLYRQNWSLCRRDREGWQLLLLPDGGWTGGERTLELPAGYYRLITAVRLPNGNQLAARREFPVEPGSCADLRLSTRSCPLPELLRCQAMPAAPAVDLNGAKVSDLFRLNGRPSLLLWLEEGREPTEHLLNELTACRDELSSLEVNVVFLLRGAVCVNQPTLAAVLARLPGVCVLLDDWAYDLEDTARRLTCDPDAAPLSVVCDGMGRAVFGDSGYRVGLGELLVRIAAHLCGADGNTG